MKNRKMENILKIIPYYIFTSISLGVLACTISKINQIIKYDVSIAEIIVIIVSPIMLIVAVEVLHRNKTIITIKSLVKINLLLKDIITISYSLMFYLSAYYYDIILSNYINGENSGFFRVGTTVAFIPLLVRYFWNSGDAIPNSRDTKPD